MSLDASTTRAVKILLLGDASVGKTSLRSQFVHHSFSTAYRATVGGDYLTSKVKTELGTAFLQIWDTAGQERFNSIARSFYRGTDVVVLVYDCTRADTFQSLNKWLNDFLENVHVTNPGILVVGNKVDKEKHRVISLRQAQEFISMNIINCTNNSNSIEIEIEKNCFESSAKTNLKVAEIFGRAAYLGLKRLEEHPPILSFDFDSIDISQPKKSSGCAC